MFRTNHLKGKIGNIIQFYLQIWEFLVFLHDMLQKIRLKNCPNKLLQRDRTHGVHKTQPDLK